MKQTDTKKNKWILYCLYTVALVLFLSYILFPTKDIGDYFKRTVQNINPDLVIDFEKISPVLPPGLKFKNMRFFKKDNPEATVFKLRKISIKPGIFSYIKGKTLYTFNSKLNKGGISGSIQFTESSKGKTVDVSMNMEDIYIHQDSGLPSIITDWVEGMLDGTVTYRGKINSPISGNGEVEISISEGLVKLTNPLPLLDLNAIEFNECKMLAKLKERKLNITSGTFKGKDMAGNTAGSILLKNDFPKSSLNLKGEIELYPSLFQNSAESGNTVNRFKKILKDGKLPFNIKGTLDNPKRNFNL